MVQHVHPAADWFQIGTAHELTLARAQAPAEGRAASHTTQVLDAGESCVESDPVSGDKSGNLKSGNLANNTECNDDVGRDEPASAMRAYSLVPKAPSKGACSQLCGCDELGVWPRCASGASKLRFVTFVSTRLEVLTRASVSTFGFDGSHRASRSASASPRAACSTRTSSSRRPT